MVAIIQSVVASLVGILAPLAKDEIILVMGIPDEIERLRTRLERILPVLANTDTQRLQDEAIDIWVKQLRDVVYDAEDIIDECKIKAEKHTSGKNHSPSSLFPPPPPPPPPPPLSSSSLSVSCCMSPFSCFSHYGVHRHQIGNKIKILNQRLDDILKDMVVLNLRSTPLGREAERRIIRETSPLVEPDLVGERMEEDTRMLVDLLLSKEHPMQQKICVFSIVGMGGIGKTTLAQKIYNDVKLQAEFRRIPPIWVCVSQYFSQIDVLKMVIEGAGGNTGEVKYKAYLEPMLCNIVEGKKIFLVLDDVWDAQIWEDLLCKPLQSCLPGSRILVTTRHEAIARRMGTVHCHQMERLSHDDGWLLLSKMVFLDGGNAGDIENNLRDVGMKIVKKCDGLPLALKTIAGVLRNKDKRQGDWEKILENPAWSLTELPEGVMGALYLSYTELPASLKQCFLYFSLFPEDCKFPVHHLVSLWISEGFVEAKGNILMEEVAKEFWRELVHRSLLQTESVRYDVVVCKMHDLLHSLARHLASHECLYWDMQQFTENSASCSSWSVKIRRAHITNSREAISDVFADPRSLRTLILPGLGSFGKDAMARFRYLRVLDIQSSSINNLPNSIGDLIHLRYLDVSASAIREIPESIGNLGNLLFLLMGYCKNLSSIPKSITKLCNLRLLNFIKSGVQIMPKGIGKLRNLIELRGFLVFNSNKNKGKKRETSNRYSSLEELSSLTQLRTLTVHKLESTSSREVARMAAVKTKIHLTDLRLHCTTCSSDVPYLCYTQEEVEKIGEVFEELCPPPCLEELTIEGYFGLEHPRWIMEMPSSYLPNLRRLYLNYCAICEKLPPLGALPQLDFLMIEGALAVKTIGPELFGLNRNNNDRGGEATHPCSSFPKLEELHIINMPIWEEWSWLREEEENQITQLLPRLRFIALEGCNKLRLLPEGLLRHATSLRQLRIEGAHNLIEIGNLPHLEGLGLIDCPVLERVSNFPALQDLVLEGCDELKHVDSLHAVKCLDLTVSRKESLPEWLLAAGQEELRLPALKMLEMRGSSHLLSRCLVDGPDWDKIRHIPRVDAYHIYKEPDYYIHYIKSPFTFDTNLPNDDSIADHRGGTTGGRVLLVGLLPADF